MIEKQPSREFLLYLLKSSLLPGDNFSLCRVVLNLLRFYLQFRPPLPRVIIFVTPRKWSSTSYPIVSHDSIALLTAKRKFAHLVYPCGSCKSQADQNSISVSGKSCDKPSNWFCSFGIFVFIGDSCAIDHTLTDEPLSTPNL